MKRVREEGHWTLFSPEEVPDLHDLYGQAFQERYEQYERLAAAGKIKLHRRVAAVDLWRKMLTRLFETGHPWVTFKDPSNIRSPQDHAGVVHSSNLCTEILLNTSRDETAVCNLGSINLKAHVRDGALDMDLLRDTVRIAMRMLDNVIDINYYPTPEAKNANLRHRPVGLGIMGFQDALAAMDLSYASEGAVEFADRSMEAISYFAILASTELAKERGTYSSYAGSKWDRGLLPIVTLDLLEAERGEKLDVDRSVTLNWEPVRAAVREYGMRNSNVMAIAPTATISTIIGVAQSIEPNYKLLYVKSNLSGEFTQIDLGLVNELKSRGLWDADMLEQLKYYDGSLSEIRRVPQDIKDKYQTAFEVDPYWIIECAARRQKWIDQGQSLNLYMAGPSGKKLNDMYMLAWEKGLKTTYYLRTLAATQVEKSTIDVNKFGVQPRWMKSKSASGDVQIRRDTPHDSGELPAIVPVKETDSGEIPATVFGQSCDPNDPTCEACQ
jgi:ribonucleoside-diphosphate reductase alpha chain